MNNTKYLARLILRPPPGSPSRAVEVATPGHDGIAPIARLTFPRAVTHAVRPRPILMIGQYGIRCRFRHSRQAGGWPSKGLRSQVLGDGPGRDPKSQSCEFL